MINFYAHNPGGKIATKLPQGMRGDARFCGKQGEYRQWLSREWGDENTTGSAFALWIGLNPSTATGNVNDPTITREIGFTKCLCSMDVYYKVNTMDYRATSPKMLLSAGVIPRSTENLNVVRELASRAAIIIFACGTAPKPFRCYVEETIATLKNDSRELWCLGTTAEGWPRHPLYLARQTPLRLLSSARATQ